MANGKAIKLKPINPSAQFKWSVLVDPLMVKRKDLPATAGIYAVIVCDAKGNPRRLPGEPANSQMKGVAYIGLTGKDHTLKGRFYALARAWRHNAKWTKPPHGSRGHYNDDPKTKKLFKVQDVRIQYMELPSDPKTENPVITALEKNLGLTAGDFRKIVGLPLTGDKKVADMEAIKMQRYKKLVGYIPILNRDEEGKGDRPPTAAELKKLLDRT